MSKQRVTEFDLLFTEAGGLTKWRKDREQAIKTDKRLSEAGKQEELAELAQEYSVKRNDLMRRYRVAKEKSRAEFLRMRDGEPGKKSDREKLRAQVHGESVLDNYLNDEAKLNLWIETIEGLQETIRRTGQISTLATVDSDRIKTLSEDAWKAGDIKQLENLLEVAFLKGHEADKKGSLLSNVIAAQMKDLRARSLTPRRFRAEKELERLDLHQQCFEEGLSLAERGGEFVDFRGGRAEQPIDESIARSLDPGFGKFLSEHAGEKHIKADPIQETLDKNPLPGTKTNGSGDPEYTFEDFKRISREDPKLYKKLQDDGTIQRLVLDRLEEQKAQEAERAKNLEQKQ